MDYNISRPNKEDRPVIYRKQKRSKKLNCIKDMPPKRHSLSDGSFDIKKSEVVNWLIQQPEVLSWLFQYIKDTGYIVFDPNIGMWRGKDYII